MIFSLPNLSAKYSVASSKNRCRSHGVKPIKKFPSEPIINEHINTASLRTFRFNGRVEIRSLIYSI